jgi:hypothetical protein
MGQVLSAGSSVVSGLIEKDAADRAYATQKNGIARQQKLLKQEYDPSRIDALVSKYDKGFLQRRLDLQKEFDPELAQLRQRGKENLLAELGRDNETRLSQKVANELFSENIKPDAGSEALKDKLFSEANAALAAGASLPPEFQAELVRSGISSAAGSGFTLDKRAVGGPVAHTLGSEAIKLQQLRQNQAIQLGQAGQQLKDARTRILSSIFPTIQNTEQTAEARSAAAFGIGNETLPTSGITGREAASFDIQGREGGRQLTGQRYDIKAQKTLRDAAFLNNAIGQVSSFGGLLYQPQQYDTGFGGNAGSPIPASGGGGGGGGGLGGLMGGGGGGGGGGMNIGSILSLAALACAEELKEEFSSVRADDILSKVCQLPVSQWRYINPELGPGNHIGTMAQDFNRLFPNAGGDKVIPLVDIIGVLLVSVQALAKKVEQLEKR